MIKEIIKRKTKFCQQQHDALYAKVVNRGIENMNMDEKTDLLCQMKYLSGKLDGFKEILEEIGG